MRLKVSPKEALTKIDNLIYEGYEMLVDCCRIAEGNGKMLREWYEKAWDVLTEVFLDFAPLYTFLKTDQEAGTRASIEIASLIDGEKDDGSEGLRAALEVLNQYYQELSAQVYTPLFYIPDKSQICFFASVCGLQPDSNEDALCKYLFEHFNFNEWVEMENIYVRAFGGNADEYDKQDKAKIENAAEGVNKKANDAFGFSVFQKKKTLLALHLPSRFLREEQRNMAI